MNKAGRVFNIQHFSVHDGPGIRTLVFLKGCPLRCQWCANPESQHPGAELAYNENKCIGTQACKLCLHACHYGAIKEKKDKVSIDRSLCTNCGECAAVCPSRALEIFGKFMGVNEVLDIVEEDSMFYSRSNGGLTLSGGEPLMQAEFTYEVLKEAKSRGITTAIETCGFTEWSNLARVCSYVDTIFYDIKCIDPLKHMRFTKAPNKEILENFYRLVDRFSRTPIIVRTPVVPGFNDSKQDILDIIEVIKKAPNVKYELLPYHRFGETKYSYLGRNYLLKDVQPPSKERMGVLKNLVQQHLLT